MTNLRFPVLFFIATLAIAAILNQNVKADDYYWDYTGVIHNDWNNNPFVTSTFTWFNATSGSLSFTAPSGGAGNRAYINNGGEVKITADIPDIQDIFVGQGTGNSGTLYHSAGNTFQGTVGWMYVGEDGGTGTYVMSGSAVQGKELLLVGRGGNGSLVMTGNSQVTNNVIVVGEGVDSVGTADVSGDAKIHSASAVYIGEAGGTGTVNIFAEYDEFSAYPGTVETNGYIAIGRNGGTGTVNIMDGATLRKTVVDDGDPNNVSYSEYSLIVVGSLGSGGTGTINLAGGGNVWSDTGIGLNETDGQAGIINQTGGTVTVHDFVNGESLDLDMNGWGQGEYYLSGGDLHAETIKVGGGLFNMTGGNLVATDFIGTLEQDGGTILPGDWSTAGMMAVTGDYNMNAGTLNINLLGTTPGTDHDVVDVSGSINLGGSLSVYLSGGFQPDAGDSFDILNFTTLSGNFTAINLPSLNAGLSWDTSNLLIDGTLLVASSALAGDLNNDGFVGIDDLNIILGNWNQSVPPSDPLADPSGDGFVGIDDLNEVLSNWNAGTPPQQPGAHIPEPTCVAYLLTSTLVWLRRY